MDDNRIQATSGYPSGYKHVSGCDRKRDSSFLAIGISPSKIISDMAFAGYCLLPGAAAHHKKNRPVNTRAETTKNRVAHLGFVVNMRPETGRKKDRGGDKKKESSCHHGHIDHSIAYCPSFADKTYRFCGGSAGSSPSSPPCLFNSEFETPVLRRCI